MKYIKYLVGAVGVLLGAFFFERSKAKSAEALNENIETKEEVQKLQAIKDVNNASIQSEEQKREDIAKQSSDEKSKPTSSTELLDFLNRKE